MQGKLTLKSEIVSEEESLEHRLAAGLPHIDDDVNSHLPSHEASSGKEKPSQASASKLEASAPSSFNQTLAPHNQPSPSNEHEFVASECSPDEQQALRRLFDSVSRTYQAMQRVNSRHQQSLGASLRASKHPASPPPAALPDNEPAK